MCGANGILNSWISGSRKLLIHTWMPKQSKKCIICLSVKVLLRTIKRIRKSRSPVVAVRGICYCSNKLWIPAYSKVDPQTLPLFLLLLLIIIIPLLTNVLFQMCWQRQSVMALILCMLEIRGNELRQILSFSHFSFSFVFLFYTPPPPPQLLCHWHTHLSALFCISTSEIERIFVVEEGEGEVN